MTPLERCWAAALCASGDAVANMGTDALRLVATKKPQDVTSAGIMESTHKLARACRIADATTTSTPAAQKAAVACGCMMDAVLNYPPRWESQDGK